MGHLRLALCLAGQHACDCLMSPGLPGDPGASAGRWQELLASFRQWNGLLRGGQTWCWRQNIGVHLPQPPSQLRPASAAPHSPGAQEQAARS